MTDIINRKMMKRIVLILVLGLINIPLSTAVWKYGALHTHTGYSTLNGYDGNPYTDYDDCPEEWLATERGYTVAELKEKALDVNLKWLGFSDHSYCLDSSEFNTIKSDCQAAQDSDFTCLWGEELSVEEDGADWWDEGFCAGDSVGHLGAYSISSFIDSEGTEWCPEWPNSQESINNVNNNGGISIINHPMAYEWDWESLGIHGGVDITSGETGIEIWNGPWDSIDDVYNTNDYASYNLWLSGMLQEGEKVFVYGGTDSHAEVSTINYNFVKMDSFTNSGLKAGLKSGTNVVSNNGYAVIRAKTNTQTTWTDMGGSLDAYTGDILTIHVEHNVVNDCTLTLRRSEIGSYEEWYYKFSVSGLDEFDVTYSLTDIGNYYFRAECISDNGNYRIYTNPIWVNVYYAAEEVCYDGVDNDNDNLVDCADTTDCPTGTKSQNGFCCSGVDAPTSGFTCSDGNCDTYSEACQNGELEPSLVCSGTSLSCSGGSCEYNFNAPQWCDEITPGGSVCENSPGSHDEMACELSGTDCYYEAEESCNAPLGCDEKNEDQCSTNSGLQCEWQNGYKDNVVEECESTCGAITQCDEKLVGEEYIGCGVNPTYFADKCSSTCQGEDSGDNICRSFAFDASCTAASSCNGLSPGTDLNTCNQIGQTYYEDECSNSCQYQDTTSLFECNEGGCSCSESLCDGLTTGSLVQTCSSGEKYFADKCTAIAGGEDRGDNICRSSTFASGCTATSECNGVVAGTGGCSATCNANQPPSTPTTLLCDGQPCTNNATFSGNIEINCSGSIDAENNFITYFVDAYYNSSETGEGWWKSDAGEGDLIGYWKMNELDDGETYNATDSSIYNQIANNSNNVWYFSGKLNNTANFTLNGVSYLNIGEYHSLYELNDSFTIAVWINNTDVSQTRYVTSVAETMLGTGMWVFDFSNVRLVYDWIGIDSIDGSLSCRINENGTININDGNWHRIVIVRDGNNDIDSLKIYVDGRLSNTTNCPSAYNFTGYAWDGDGEFRIGSSEAGGYAIEAVDDLQLWNITWTLDDVIYDWNNGIGREAEEAFSGYAWRNIGNHSETSVLNWNIKNIQPQSEVDLRCRAIDLEGSNIYSNYYAPLINLTITLPNDVSKFYIKNSSQDNVAWFGNEGNIVLKGKCNVMNDCTSSSENSFVIGNSTDDVVAYINSTGDLCIEKGSCSSSTSCVEKNAFKIRNYSQNIVNYIDFDGELCFTGGLYENSNP